MSEQTMQNIQDMKEEVLIHWDKVDENWENGKISGGEMENLNDLFNKLLSALQTEQTKIYTKTTKQEEANVQVSHGLSDGQEQTINSNVNGGTSTVQVNEAITDDISNESDISDNDLLPGLIDENAEEEMG